MAQPQFPGESVSLLADQVHDPCFFAKLADWNIYPRSQQERDQCLELALLLREANDTETVKTAVDGNPFLSGALDSLKVAMGAHGYDTPPTSDVTAIKNLAAQAVQNPYLQKAALDYGAFLLGAN